MEVIMKTLIMLLVFVFTLFNPTVLFADWREDLGKGYYCQIHQIPYDPNYGRYDLYLVDVTIAIEDEASYGRVILDDPILTPTRTYLDSRLKIRPSGNELNIDACELQVAISTSNSATPLILQGDIFGREVVGKCVESNNIVRIRNL